MFKKIIILPFLMISISSPLYGMYTRKPICFNRGHSYRSNVRPTYSSRQPRFMKVNPPRGRMDTRPVYSPEVKREFCSSSSNDDIVRLMQPESRLKSPQHDMYSTLAKDFLKDVNDLTDTSSKHVLDQESLTQYLDERISNAEQILSGSKQILSGSKDEKLKDEELNEWLDPHFMKNVLAFTLMDWDTKPDARALLYYPIIVDNDRSFLLAERLRCRASDYEEPYPNTLKQVSLEEFEKKRKAAISPDTLDDMRLQSSRDFAKAILEEQEKSK